MAEQPCALLAQPVTFTAETWTVTDDVGTNRSVSFPSGTYRVLLGSTSTRTAAAPGDLLAHIEAALGASCLYEERSITLRTFAA